MSYFEHEGCRFNFEIRGEGPRVLFFNGSGASIESSAPLINALSKNLQVLVHDQRGLGKSSVPEGPYSMAQYASDGFALMKHVGWESCNVIGISFGGMVAQEFAVTWPQVVSKLVLMCTSAGGDAGSSYPLHQLATMTPEDAFTKRLELTDSRFVDVQWVASDPIASAIVKGMEDAQRIEKSEMQRKGERLQLEARIGHNVADRLKNISCPTFVLAGKYDGIAPVENSEEIAARIEHSVMSVYEGGHLFSAQDRNAIADIRSFLSA